MEALTGSATQTMCSKSTMYIEVKRINDGYHYVTESLEKVTV